MSKTTRVRECMFEIDSIVPERGCEDRRGEETEERDGDATDG